MRLNYLRSYLAVVDERREKEKRVNFCDVFQEVARAALEAAGEETMPADERALERICAFIEEYRDCLDFALNAILRILYQFPENGTISPQMMLRLGRQVLHSPYWIDERHTDSMCMFTENHLILCHTAEYLAGQLYPNERFANNGETGQWHMHHARPLLLQWLRFRMLYGFTEWNSHSYYDEDLIALVNLRDLCADPMIRDAADSLITILLAEIASHSHEGVMGCTHGRAYAQNIVNPENEAVRAISHLYFGTPCENPRVSLSAVLLAISDYQPPGALADMLAVSGPVALRERHSLSVEGAAERGYDPSDERFITTFWGMQSFEHPAVVDATLRALPPWHYHRGVAESFKAYYERCAAEGIAPRRDLDYFALTEVNAFTYRLPGAMLSAACEYRAGEPGYQQHIWQATLGGRAMAFSTQPGPDNYGGDDRPNALHGNMVMPKAVACEGVAIAMYSPDPAVCRVYHTHAYFPVAAFDETAEQGGWVFGRRGTGYVALRSMRPAAWREPDERLNALNGLTGRAILQANGSNNAWICEIGDRCQWGSFSAFVTAISRAAVEGDERGLRYVSPMYGEITAGFLQKTTLRGEKQRFAGFPRHESPWMRSEFGSGEYAFRDFALKCGVPVGATLPEKRP